MKWLEAILSDEEIYTVIKAKADLTVRTCIGIRKLDEWLAK